MRRLLEKYGPWALVTGASSGLGAEFARQLAAQGFHLAILARRENRLRELKSELEEKHRIQVKVIVADLSEEDFLSQVRPITESLEIGLLVNNAGFSITGDLLEQDPARHVDLLHVNCRAPLMLAHEFGRPMKERKKGGIIFVSSVVAFVASPGWSNYAASKAYVLLLAEGLASELKEHGVQVLVLCPGTTRTEFQSVAGTNEFLAQNPDFVVSLALRSLGRRQTVIAGLENQLVAFSSRLIPRSLNRKIAGFVVDRLQR